MSGLSSVSERSYVLFLDLWGTTAKIFHTQNQAEETEHFFEQADIELCQAHFVRVLNEMAHEFPRVDIKQAGDTACVYAEGASELLAFAAQVFQRMLFFENKLVLWPLRAGIAEGLKPLSSVTQLQSVANFTFSPLGGSGSVEAARLEKSGQKGMRVLISKSVAEKISAEFGALLRFCNTKGMEHYEFNWLMPTPGAADVLDTALDGRAFREVLMDRARQWLDVSDNFYQQMGSSWNDLLKWRAKI